MKENVLKRKQETITLLGILVIVICFMGLMDRSFFTVENGVSLAGQIPELGILTLAMVLPMISGGINLSIIACANLSSILIGLIMTSEAAMKGNTELYILLAVAVGLLVSFLVGLLNGAVITILKVPPMVATLCIQLFVNGISTGVTKGYVVSGIPEQFLALNTMKILGLPLICYIFLICVVVLGVVLNDMPLGKYIYLYGSNPIATGFSGVRIRTMLIKTYVISNLLSGMTAIIMLARFNSASVSYSTSYLLQTILICVLGGLNPNGGSGRLENVFLAIIILKLISNGLNILNVSSHLILAIWGALLIVSLFIRRNSSTN